MNLNPGTKLGRYEIRSKIGEGGMGEVYLAEDTKLDRKVALKILPADVAADVNDKLIEARMTLAVIEFQYDWDFARAEKDFQQVIALNPNYAEGHHQYA